MYFKSFKLLFTYIYFYNHKKNIIIIGPYEIRFISKFNFFIFIFLYSVLMVKLNFINQKACLINWVLQFYLYQILFSIIFWIPF